MFKNQLALYRNKMVKGSYCISMGLSVEHDAVGEVVRELVGKSKCLVQYRLRIVS